MILTHLKAIPATILSVSTNKVHNHSQTRLNPQVFLEIKKSRRQRIFVETDTQDCKSVLQKYFGKKVLYATSRSDLVHTISSRKFVDEIKFSEGILEDYKCLSNRILLGEPIEILCKKEYEKLISTSISKIAMDFYNDGVEARTLKSIRPFAKDIKHLNLRLPTSTRGKRGRRRGQSNNNFVDMKYLRIVELSFPMLDKLETFTLKFPSTYTKSDVNNDKYVQQMEAFLGYLQKIVKLKSLRRINIDLFKMGINCKFLKDLLLCLDTSHIEKWHFIGFLEEEMLDANAIGPLLENIDFLGLKFTTSLNDRIWPDYMPLDLREMPELTATRKKILDLEMMYDDDGLTVELAEILSHGKSLEGLYIKSLCQDRINWETTDLASLALVKDLVLVWDEDQGSIDEYDDQFLKDFLSEFKKENSVLRSLKIFFRNTYCDEENNFEERWTISAYITDLQGMKSLEELTLYSDGEIYDGDADDAGNAFDSLVNLKRLTLHLCASNNTSDWDDEFPFNNLSRLTEFRLIIHPDMQLAEWDESFAAHISLLPDLEVLEIIDKTEKKMSLCVLYNILKELARFQNLRKLILQTHVKRFVSKETLFIVGQEFYQERELKVIEDIKGKIVRLISANPMLEEMDIGDFEGYSISQAFYRKLMDKE